MAEAKSKPAASKASSAAKPAAAKKTSAAKSKAATSPKASVAAKKPAAPKKAPAAKKVKAAPGAEERYRMIEVAAYFIAERHGFAGDPKEFWAEAEAQINRMLP